MAKPAKTLGAALTHEQIWSALDRLAVRASLSPSGLARRAGLDPTTFNKSKRITADGRERWPSTESLAKALAAADASIDTFVQLIGESARQDHAPATAIRRGDRVAVKTSDGELVVGELKRRTAKMLELTVDEAGERMFATNDVEWIARIVWSKQ